MKQKLLLIITGAIAATGIDVYLYYLKEFFDINIVLTYNALNFVDKKVLSFYCEDVYEDMFIEKQIPHVVLPHNADLLLVFPATANFIGKVANGIADDLASASVLNYSGNIIFCPSMNHIMWNNPIVQRNVLYLESLGHNFIFNFKKSYEVGLKCVSEKTCTIPTPSDLIKRILSLERGCKNE